MAESPQNSSKIDEEELERLAVEALMEEARHCKTRAEQVGTMGWKKCELPKTNKRFLGNLVISAVSSNRKRAKLESHDSSKHVREQDPEWKRKVEHEKLPAKMEHREGSHKKQSTSKDKKR